MLSFCLLPQVSWISDKEIRRLQAALTLASGPCAAEWLPGELPAGVCPSVSVAAHASDLPEYRIPIVLGPKVDVPGAMAIHEMLDGRPYALVLANESEVTLADVQMGASHELLEMIGDLLCDQRVLLASGNLIDREICDPVQGDTMMIDLGDGGKPLSMSNWVTQQWFNKNARHEAKLDALGLCTKPLMIRPGGYAIQVDPGGNIHQLGEGPAAYKRNPSFRHGRRLSNAFSYGFKVRHRAHPLRSSVGPPDRDLR